MGFTCRSPFCCPNHGGCPHRTISSAGGSSFHQPEGDVGRMASPGTGFHAGHVVSSMCAAALPPRKEIGRQDSDLGPRNPITGVGLETSIMSRLGKRGVRQEPKYTTQDIAHGRISQAWDSYEYRARVPTLAQFDRDASSRRKKRTKGSSYDTGLINMGTVFSSHKTPSSRKSAERPSGGKQYKPDNGGYASFSKSTKKTQTR